MAPGHALVSTTCQGSSGGGRPASNPRDSLVRNQDPSPIMLVDNPVRTRATWEKVSTPGYLVISSRMKSRPCEPGCEAGAGSVSESGTSNFFFWGILSMWHLFMILFLLIGAPFLLICLLAYADSKCTCCGKKFGEFATRHIGHSGSYYCDQCKRIV